MEAETWRDIRARHASGEAIKAIARTTGVSRNTVRRALQSDAPPARRTRPSARSVIDGYEEAVRGLLAADPSMPATEIARRVGWPHSMTALKEHVRGMRDGPAPPGDDRPIGAADLTSFVGRDEEIAAILHAVRSHRLVSLVGPGGVGKSRLALRAAAAGSASFPDGVRFIELAALRDPGLVAQTLLDGLRVPHGDRAAGSSVRVLVGHLRRRTPLIVLDNCEHLLDAVAGVLHPLLREAPHVRVLVTTRQTIGVAGEHVIPVPPLGVPPTTPSTAEDALRYPAVALFADRAGSVLPTFALDRSTLPDVVELCRRLDGVPLAVELAAVRLRVLSVRQLLTRLADRFAVLTDGDRAGPARHRTLLATVAWSHELCTATERTLWNHATVFPGSFDLDALDAVCSRDASLPDGVPLEGMLDALSGLTSKSILVREEDAGAVRFRMLETIREYGREGLGEQQRHALRARHLAYRIAAHNALATGWYGPDQPGWARCAKAEQADLRAALDHALVERGDGRAALQLAGTPWFQWAVSVSMTEHRRWLHRALAAATEPTPERARALVTAALVASLQGDQHAAAALVEDGGLLARELDDPRCSAFATHTAGLVAFFSDEFARAAEHFAAAERAYREVGAGPDLVAALDVHIGLLGISRGDLDDAERRLRRTCERCRAAGEIWFRSYAVVSLGFIALLRHDVAAARRCSREGLELIAGFDDTIGLSLALDLAAWTAAEDGRYERAAVLLGGASVRWGSFGQQLYGSSDWQSRRQAYEERARSTLGTAVFDAAFRHGSAMNAADMPAYALSLRTGPVVPVADLLTAREHEIVRLVADGMTNREIAAALVLSHRTVEGHVSRVLAKLGFRRRTQLATWLERTRVHDGR